MGAVLITRREIQVNAILDILDETQRAKLDEITRLINELAPDLAIKVEVVDVERQISQARLPRMPKRPRDVVRMVRANKVQPWRDPAQQRRSRHATERAKEVLELFEDDEWIGLKELTRLLGRSERYTKDTMKMLVESGLFREDARADELTHHMVPHYQVVKSRLKKMVDAMPVGVAEQYERGEAAARPAVEEDEDAEVMSTEELLAGAPRQPADDLGLDLFDTVDLGADLDMADFSV